MHACIWKSRGAFAQPPQPTCTTACMTTQLAICLSESSTSSNTPPRCASDLLQGLVWLLCLAFKVEKLSWTSWTEKDWGIQRINEKKGQCFRLTSDKKWKKLTIDITKWDEANKIVPFLWIYSLIYPFAWLPVWKGLATYTRTCNTARLPA